MTPAPWGLLALAAGTLACSPGDCPAPPADVLGKWTYMANQTAPSTATLGGVLTLQTGCPGLQGSLDGTENDGFGMSAPFNAIVVGQMIGTAGVDFDAAGRRHIGTVANDSIHGTWFDQSAGGSGPFVAVKELTP
jgi:hypothetical protein